MNKENLPKKDCIWVVFDLDNGHEPSKHYCWWFNTRKDARNHIKHHNTYKHHSTLSAPQKFWHLKDR
jgi:hypothetical protein